MECNPEDKIINVDLHPKQAQSWEKWRKVAKDLGLTVFEFSLIIDV